MTLVDEFYATIALSDATVLFIWGLIDLRAKHYRDGAFLLILSLLGFTAYGLGQYKDRELDKIIADAGVKQKELEAANLKLTLKIEDERKQRVLVESTLEDFRHISELSDEALAGSNRAFTELERHSREKSSVGKRAQERVRYIRKSLAYYDQPPGIVLTLELSETVAGQQIRISSFSTAVLFKLLQNDSISDSTRFSIMNDICTKPIAEVDALSMEMLRISDSLPAIAGTTAILRRLHQGAVPFMDKSDWIKFLIEHRQHGQKPQAR